MPIKSNTSAFLKEIEEQPSALKRLIRYYRGEGRPKLMDWAKRVRKARRVVFSGMGTSEYVPDLIQQTLGLAGIDASIHEAGELDHYFSSRKALYVLISQSGESAETRHLAKNKSLRNRVIAISNNPQSTLAKASSLFLPLLAGKEAAISTKTYSNSLGLMFLMGQAVIGTKALDKALKRLEMVSSVMGKVDLKAIQKAAALLADRDAIHFIARGPSVAAARQSALTFMEGANVSATAFTGGSFRHGPYELLGPKHRSVLFAPKGRTFLLMKAMAREIAEAGGHVVVFSDQRFKLPKKSLLLKMPMVGEELFPLACCITQERLLHEVARRRGKTAGVFRRCSKITDKE